MIRNDIILSGDFEKAKELYSNLTRIWNVYEAGCTINNEVNKPKNERIVRHAYIYDNKSEALEDKILEDFNRLIEHYVMESKGSSTYVDDELI